MGPPTKMLHSIQHDAAFKKSARPGQHRLPAHEGYRHIKSIQAVGAILAQLHHFDPKDGKAIGAWETVADSAKIIQSARRWNFY